MNAESFEYGDLLTETVSGVQFSESWMLGYLISVVSGNPSPL